jgi:hypothetical protein
MAAEWCDTDDLVRHVAIDGQHVAVRVRVQGYVEKQDMNAWHRDAENNVMILEQEQPGTIRLMVIGPPGPWRVGRIEANGGYALAAPAAPEYPAGTSATFTLRAA